MADKKISALTAATTPLAGTEVLPIVQGGSTVKVSAANLTAGRDISTTGITVSSNTGNIELNWAAGSTHKVGSTFSTGYFTGMRVDADTRNTDIISFDASGAGNVRLRTGVTETTRLNVDPTGNVTVSTGNLIVGTAGKGIVDSTGTTSLQFTSLQVASNKQIVAPSVVTATGNTASTPTATAVTLFTPSGDGVWIVNALVTLTGAPAAYIASSMIKASGGVLAATAISTATNMSISVSGANVQATQTSGGNQVIAFSYIRLF